MNKGQARQPPADPRGRDFVRDQQRAWTWEHFAVCGDIDAWGKEYVRTTELSTAGRLVTQIFAKKHRWAQRALSAVKSIERGLKSLTS